ncbi:hypothetical protein BDV38DRAFT_272673 [Aspergillus pseudotamarii]|uniref:Uncharacterized protein n=1 Tax=Aspergillus pseudotamarii TaxID=132259 RepID=A0A5N6SR85_ASPPS|nr:uncharacterized protein BDV38DRAFT_272673 [Aspergillus pseudotamarii]KAE8135654.1 hypothetical protein BDV38DRAFT_272673 [Aspergillus pseudotamarii]
MALQERVGSLLDIPIIPPPFIRSLQRSRSSSPTRPSDTQYHGGHLRRAKIFLTISILTKALYTAINNLKPAGFEAVRNRVRLARRFKPPVQNPRPTILQENASTDSSRVIEPVIPVFKLKGPRPDIYAGLSDDSLADALKPTKDRYIVQSLLLDIQDASTLISNLYIYPNQAAVDGSVAILILQSLSDLRDGQDLNKENYDNVFSIATEGPVYELWIHFREPTRKLLHAVLRGGNSELKCQIISILNDL